MCKDIRHLWEFDSLKRVEVALDHYQITDTGSTAFSDYSKERLHTSNLLTLKHGKWLDDKVGITSRIK